MPVQAAVGRLKLAGLGHAETPIRQRAESLDQIAGLGHEVHDATVEQGSVGPRSGPKSEVESVTRGPRWHTVLARHSFGPAAAFE